MNGNLVVFCWILTVLNWRSGLSLPLDDSIREKSLTEKENPPFPGPSLESTPNNQLPTDSENLSEYQTNPTLASGSINTSNFSLPSLTNEGNSTSLEKEPSTDTPLTSTINYGNMLTEIPTLNDTFSNVNSAPYFTDTSNQFMNPETETTQFKDNEKISNLNFKGINFTDIDSPAVETNSFVPSQNTSTIQHVYDSPMVTQAPSLTTIGSSSNTSSDSQNIPSSFYLPNSSATEPRMKQNITENNITSPLIPSAHHELRPVSTYIPANTSGSSTSKASDTSSWILDMHGNPISLSPNDIYLIASESSIQNNNSLAQDVTTPFPSSITNKKSILPITVSPTSTNEVPKTESSDPRTCTEWDGPEKTYTGPCDICRCIYGLVRCFNKDCPKAPAPNCIANLVEGKCCPVHDCPDDGSTQQHDSQS